jgi:hypothetical protein
MNNIINIIIDGFHAPPTNLAMEKIVKDLNFNYCEWIVGNFCNLNEIDGKLKIKKFNDLSFAEYKNVDFNDLIPLDYAMINSMIDCEEIVLKMMDRLEWAPECLSYSKRKYIYLRHLRYWNHVIITKKINLYFGSNIPHDIYDFIIYSLCKLKNIRTVFFHQSSIPDQYFVLSNYKEFMTEIKIKYDDLYNDFLLTKKPICLSKRYQDYLDEQLNNNKDPIPFWAHKKKVEVNTTYKKKKKSLLVFITIFKKFFTFLKKLKYLFYPKKFLVKTIIKLYDFINKKDIIQVKTNVIDNYNNNSIEPDLTKRFIYLALHYQPELTTSPLAGVFVDQYLIADILSFCLPDDIYIYIKEHPKQDQIGRYSDFYNHLKKIKNVAFINRDYNSYKLLDHCIAVATCTGTAGWEALFREKPVLLFGNFFYQYAKGVFQIKNVQDCQEALTNIFNKKELPTVESITIFLKAMELNLLEGYVDLDYKVISTLDIYENEKKLYDSIYKTIINN